MHTYIYMYIHIMSVYIYIYVYTYICTYRQSLYTYTCIYIHTCIYILTYIHTMSIYTYMYVYTYIYLHTQRLYTYTYIYIYIYIQNNIYIHIHVRIYTHRYMHTGSTRECTGSRVWTCARRASSEEEREALSRAIPRPLVCVKGGGVLRSPAPVRASSTLLTFTCASSTCGMRHMSFVKRDPCKSKETRVNQKRPV